MIGAIRRTVEHVNNTRHSDTGAALAELPTIRNYIARMRVKADLSDALLGDTIAAITAKRAVLKGELTMNENTVVLGAVAYDPKVVTIWDGFQTHFDRCGLKFDYVLYTNYERQVEALIAGQIHVAWNSPLA